MALLLLLCLDWVTAYESAPVLSEPESVQTYRDIMARHAALEKYWLTLSGTLKTSEKTSGNPNPAETKIYLKVQGKCYRKGTLVEFDGYAHWVPHLDLRMGNDRYFADLYRAKSDLTDPHEIVEWTLRGAYNRPTNDRFINFYLSRIYRETTLSTGYSYWRWSYLLARSANHLRSIKKVTSRFGTFLVLKFAPQGPGIPIANDIDDWTQTQVGAAQEGWIVYDTNLGAIISMDIHWLTGEDYHFHLTESVNYQKDGSLLLPVHRQSGRHLLSAQGKIPRSPQIDQFICDYDLSLVSHPAELFTLSSFDMEEPADLKTFSKFRGMLAEPREAMAPMPPQEPPPTPSASVPSGVVAGGLVLLLGVLALGVYLLYFLQKRRGVRAKQLSWVSE